jgi:hypothetical protein
MNLKGARQAFEDRFYIWAKDQCCDEFQKGYPLLRRIRSSNVLRAVEIADFLSKTEGHRLALLYIRRVHKEAAARAHVAVNADEERWFQRYMASHVVPSREEIRIRGWDKPQEHFWVQSELAKIVQRLITGRPQAEMPEPLDLPAGLRDKVRNVANSQELSRSFTPHCELPKDELKANEANLVNELEKFKIDRKALRTSVTNELSKHLAVKRKKDSSREDIYEVPIGPWVVSTLVDFGTGRMGGFQLRYSQGVRLSNGESLTSHPTLAINSMSWLGPGVPHWDLLTNSDLEEAAVVLCLLCTRFVEAATAMLEGLDKVSVSTDDLR